MLRCFVEKVSNIAILHFLVAFSGTLWNFRLLFGIFWHYLGLLVISSYIVAVWICHNLHTFCVKYFWHKPCLCKKNVFLHVCLDVYS